MAPPSADVADVEGEEVIPNGLANGAGYVNLSENPTGQHDDAIGFNPVGNGVVNGAENAGSNGALQTERPRSQGTVVNINGVEMTVYGNIQGLEFLNLGNNSGPEIDVDAVDPEEEEEEARQRLEAERAIREAEEADRARRSAPLPAEQCQTIRNAMRGITLDFRPDWAGSIPEQEWMSRILESGGSARGSSPGDRRNSSS
ncbi:hypothetical protein M758_11G154800 [Ceratodon purpureus]|nr:hypothetical protein M758_11G154800 [Ceratodon purpureus]